jgi:hypothetical protein
LNQITRKEGDFLGKAMKAAICCDGAARGAAYVPSYPQHPWISRVAGCDKMRAETAKRGIAQQIDSAMPRSGPETR